VGGWVGGWVGVRNENKANSVQLELELGLSLAIIFPFYATLGNVNIISSSSLCSAIYIHPHAVSCHLKNHFKTTLSINPASLSICPSVVRALPLAAGINVGGHYARHYFSSSSSLFF
jgi:hypothetical protein